MNFSDRPSHHSQIAVLYLARKAEGLDAFRTFMCSYATHPAGIDHDLVVIFKGYDGGSDLEGARSVFSSFQHISMEVSDEGFDLGSYLEATKRLTHEYICCLNTFSKILSENWLKKLYSHSILPDVGIVGATGSYEGTHSSVTLLQKALWLNSQPELDKMLQTRLNKYFDFIFQHPFSQARDTVSTKLVEIKKANALDTFKSIHRHLTGFVIDRINSRRLERSYIEWWSKIQKREDIAKFCQFPLFPNPHIRSNAFIINRERFLTLNHSSFISKLDSCHLESGYGGMTRQLLSANLKARIVGKNGVGYDVDKWPSSNTFRLGDQSNLLVADNQTHIFTAANCETRFVFALMSWGEDSLSIPNDFPNLKIKFQADRNF
jgi:hypothetical protein